MAIITSEVLTACGVKPEDREERARTALERKYGAEFEITEVYPQKFGELYYEVQAYAVEEPQLRFTASIDTEDDRISDNYVERRVCAAVSRQAEENLDRLPGYYFLFTHTVGPQPITDSAAISPREYMALDAGNRFRIELFVKPEDADAAALYGSLEKLFSGLEYLTGDARLYLVGEEEMEAVQAYFESNDDLYFEYQQLTKELFRLELPYENGAIRMREDEFAAAVRDVL